MAAARASTLGDRLKRIRAGSGAPSSKTLRAAPGVSPKASAGFEGPQCSITGDCPLGRDWKLVAPLVAERTISIEIPFSDMPAVLDTRLTAWCWRKEGVWADSECGVDVSRLLFFDLETTGLSSGAGTVAFLAAFGRIHMPPDNSAAARIGALPVLSIRQYLLLDYGGEADFLEALHRAFEGDRYEASSNRLPHSSEIDFDDKPVIVSFNGKTYDSQLVRTRFVMNAIAPPRYLELDLLYPARRLFRTALPSCALMELERSLLEIVRVDDLPGALAPAAWFSFLKTGEKTALERVAEHNARDLIGLAGLAGLLDGAFRAPKDFAIRHPASLPGLASIFVELDALVSHETDGGEAVSVGRTLLEMAAQHHLPSRFLLARLLRSEGQRTRARDLFTALCDDPSFDDLAPGMRARSLRAAAILARLDMDGANALRLTRAELSISRLSTADRLRAERRLERFEAIFSDDLDRKTGAELPPLSQ